MIELIFLIFVVIVYSIYRIYRFAMSQSAKEKEFWQDQKMLNNGISCKLYALTKGILLIIAILGGMLILISLIYGQVPTWHDIQNEKCQTAIIGAGFLGFTQFISLAIIWLAKNIANFNAGKILLFFLIIGSIATLLITGICIALF